MGAVTAAASGLVGFGIHRQLLGAGVRPDRATLLAAICSLVIFVLAAAFVVVGPSPLWAGLVAAAAAGLSVAHAELH